MNISAYLNSTDSEGFVVDYNRVISSIKSGTHKDLVYRIRNESDKTLRDSIKKTLPSFIVSGVFHPTRGISNLVEPTSLMILDVDDKHKGKSNVRWINDLKWQISHDQHTKDCFVSPGGKGLKIVVEIADIVHIEEDEVVDGSGDMKDNVPFAANIYRNTFIEIVEPYYRDKFGIHLDPSGKNVNRICFSSYDPLLFHNDNPVPFQGIHKIENYAVRQVDAKEVADVSIMEKMEYAINCCAKAGKEFCENNRNNYVFYLSCTLNRFGVYFDDALELVALFYGLDTQNKEDEWYKTIRSAYVNNKSEFQSYPVRRTVRNR